ncbi:MAG: hypothetical protein ABJA82_08340 [Myxococcales bacterium]
MNRPISSRRGPVVARLSTLALLAGLFVLPVLAGCPGSLGKGDWPAGTGSPGTGGATGTGGSGTGTGGSGPACDAPTMVFMPKCSGATCHLPSPGIFPPDFSNLAALKTTTAASSLAPCKGKPIVDPATPGMSVLVTRVTGSTCGERMPDMMIDNTVKYLTQPEIDCVSSWAADFARQ